MTLRSVQTPVPAWCLVRAAVLVYTVAAVLAQSVTPPSYSWLERTISALGAQGFSYGWIMRTGMVGYGLLLSAGLSRRIVRGRRPQGRDLVLMLHAVLIGLAGLVPTSPFGPGIAYSAAQGYWHWNFAIGAGASFGAGVVWHLSTETNPRKRWMHLVVAVLVATLSAGFGLASARTIAVGAGLVQRLLHAVGLAWLWITYGQAGELAGAPTLTSPVRAVP